MAGVAAGGAGTLLTCFLLFPFKGTLLFLICVCLCCLPCLPCIICLAPVIVIVGALIEGLWAVFGAVGSAVGTLLSFIAQAAIYIAAIVLVVYAVKWAY